MKELFVCEKPGQARDFAEAISGGYQQKKGYVVGDDGKVYTSAVGHLVELDDIEQLNWDVNPARLPYFEKELPLKVIPDTKDQFKIVTDLMREAETIIIATDAGREGEHIFRKIYKKGNIKKPLKRIWVSDYSKSGINKAYQFLKDGSDYEGLALAGQLREEADFLLGANTTIVATKLSGNKKLISLGRVQTPTLAMIVNRDDQIENFKKVESYTVAAKANDFEFEMKLDKDQFLSEVEANSIKDSLSNRTNCVIDEKDELEKPKHLFDLTLLQRYMNSKHKWTAKKTLDVLQSLYQTHKVVTYPRTSSKYVASSEEFPKLLESHRDDPMVAEVIEKNYEIEKSFVNPKEVTDHEAIIITKQTPSSLNKDESLLYNIVFTRFIAAFYPPAVYHKTNITFDDGEQTFKTSEKVLVDPGWLKLYKEVTKDPKLKNVTLSDVGEYFLKKKETKPPKRYTEASLLGDMENAAKFLEDQSDKKLMKRVEGIGTPATRASIIEKLVKRNYIEKKNNQIVSTTLGQEIIGMMPKDFTLYSVKLTAYFETLLTAVETGEIDGDTFYEEFQGFLLKADKEIKGNVKQLKTYEVEKEVIAKCPNCGKPIYENSKAYGCSGFKEGCKTTVWKNGLEKLGKKKVTKNEAKKLLEGKEVNVTLKSKKGNSYKAGVVFNKDKNWIEFAKSFAQ
ncbi:DNA topoisomerase [Paraliobacillus ryukyuensis]|uniref:DNA topoisomerase n=1 Tax=Paraliobacillus ryukyuensis TaxID=200904 RepID=UPI0009A566A1|nr:DNA topoisomerase [Paraliobacillus ryukyuensis]